MGDPVIILGAHSLGRVVLEIFQKSNVVVYGFLDDDQALRGQIIDGVPVLGNTAEEQYLDLIGEQCDVFVAMEQQAKRQRLVAMLHKRRKTIPVNAIHPSAIIATSAVLGHGNLIDTSVSLGAGASVDSHCILHTRVTVEHDAVIKKFVQIGAGSIIGAGTQLDNGVFVGAGATIVAGVIVGEAARIGAGAVVLTNVKAGATVLGNPAVPTERK